MLTWTLENKRDRFCGLLQEIVSQSITYRGRSPKPLSREEVDELNQLVLKLSFKVPELHDLAFLDALPRAKAWQKEAQPEASTSKSIDYKKLAAELLALSSLQPVPRGFAFEKFLEALFHAFSLTPRGSFRNVGEQIDGSFLLHHETYLMEARWRNELADASDLRAFSEKVSDKFKLGRGLFISNSGFSEDGLRAFGQGKAVVCMDGLDLFDLLSREISLAEVVAAKVRRLAESGKPFTRVRELFN